MEERKLYMRKMLGGLILLNLLSISLDVTAGEIAIENQEVLNQLVDLRNFIDEKRDFTKQSKGLKPVVVAYRSSASKVDGIMNCNLSFNEDAYNLSIAGYSVQADGTPITLTINVEYEFTEYEEYTIKSATINATNTISGASIESIVDKNGNKRFIEGDIEIEVIAGVTQTYGKWSLSGSHLLIVIAGNVANETAITSGRLAQLNLPDWIKEKIIPVFSNVVDYKSIATYNVDWSTQAVGFTLRKYAVNNEVSILIENNVTFTKDRSFRIAFDLLIDNETPESQGE